MEAEVRRECREERELNTRIKDAMAWYSAEFRRLTGLVSDTQQARQACERISSLSIRTASVKKRKKRANRTAVKQVISREETIRKGIIEDMKQDKMVQALEGYERIISMGEESSYEEELRNNLIKKVKEALYRWKSVPWIHTSYERGVLENKFVQLFPEE